MGGLPRTATVADTLEQGLAMHTSYFLSTYPALAALLQLRQSRALGTPRSRLLLRVLRPVWSDNEEASSSSSPSSPVDSNTPTLPRSTHVSRGPLIILQFFEQCSLGQVPSSLSFTLSLNDRRHCATPGRTCPSLTHPPTSCPASSFVVATRDSWFGDTKTDVVLSRRNQRCPDTSWTQRCTEARTTSPPSPLAKKKQCVSLTLASLGRFTRGLSRKSDEKCHYVKVGAAGRGW